MPRVVRAGVPRRMPLVSAGLRVSKGIMFLLQVIPASSSAFSACLPPMPSGVTSTSMQVVVGAAADQPQPALTSASASALALATTCCA